MKKAVTFFLIFIVAIAENSVAFSQHIQNTNIALFQKTDTNNFSKSLYQYSETDIILQTAKKQINLFIDNIPNENLNDYGFKNKEEFEKISFDTPIKIYTLKDSNIVFTSTWRIPIVIDNEYRALLTIIKENEEYKIVDFGACVLAKEISAKKTNQTLGLLRVYEIKSDFIIEGYTKNQLKFIPIQGSKDKLYDLVDIFNMIKNNKQ